MGKHAGDPFLLRLQKKESRILERMSDRTMVRQVRHRGSFRDPELNEMVQHQPSKGTPAENIS